MKRAWKLKVIGLFGVIDDLIGNDVIGGFKKKKNTIKKKIKILLKNIILKKVDKLAEHFLWFSVIVEI